MCVQAFYSISREYILWSASKSFTQLQRKLDNKASTYITSDEFLYEAEEIVWNYLWSRELNGLKK